MFRVTQIKTYSWDNAQVVLVGNKCDMKNERVVGYDRGRLLAEHLGSFNHFYAFSKNKSFTQKISFQENYL